MNRLSKRMIALLISILAIVLIAGYALRSSDSTQGHDESLSLLWEIYYQDQKVGTLFGTIHLGTNTSKIPQKAKEALALSDVLITEIQVLYPNTQDKLKAERQVVSELFPPSKTPLYQRVDQATFELLSAYFEKRGIPERIYSPLNTKAILTMMMLDITGLYPQYGMEALITKSVKDRDIENIPLESMKQSLSIYSDALGDLTVPMMSALLQEFEVYQATISDLYQAYEKNDVAKLLAVTKEMDEAMVIPEYSEQLQKFNTLMLNDRNVSWMEILTPLLKEVGITQQYFIAVGALHLFEEGGLVDLLEREGFTLKPVAY